jgi:hypothetical protein
LSSSAGGRHVKFDTTGVDAIEGGNWRSAMSGTLSAAVRFEDHFGPVVPGAVSPKPSVSPAGDSSAPTTGVQDLVATMRLSVVQATEATDVAAKVELWEAYRAARAEALALLTPVATTTDSRHLYSV